MYISLRRLTYPPPFQYIAQSQNAGLVMPWVQSPSRSHLFIWVWLRIPATDLWTTWSLWHCAEMASMGLKVTGQYCLEIECWQIYYSVRILCSVGMAISASLDGERGRVHR